MRTFQVSYLALGALLALVAGVSAAEWGLAPINEAVARAEATTDLQAGIQSAPATGSSDPLRPVDEAPVAVSRDPPAIESSIADVRPSSPVIVADEADAVSTATGTEAPPPEIGANVADGNQARGDLKPAADPN